MPHLAQPDLAARSAPPGARFAGLSTPRLLVLRLLLLGFASFALPACAPVGEGLLAGVTPTVPPGVERPERLSDGVALVEGATWSSGQAVVLPPGAVVHFDLGRERVIRAALLQGDVDDIYTLLASRDGVEFAPFWTAPPLANATGLRTRFSVQLEIPARFVRLMPLGGDGRYSVAELQLFEQRPSPWPREPVREQPAAPGAPFRAACSALAAALVLALIVARAGLSRGMGILLAVPVALATFGVVVSLDTAWPPHPESVSWVRALAALVAAVASARLVATRGRPHRRLCRGVLAVAALVAVACFFNLGHPQFTDAATGRPSYVHAIDQRVYHSAAKYFDELGYDGVYAGGVAAAAELHPEISPDALAGVVVRDLRDHQIRRVGELAGHPEQVRSRFSPRRWQEFKRDQAYFISALGLQGFLHAMVDHGANATPTWLAINKLLFAPFAATDLVLFAAALLDPLLLLGLFVALVRAFGVDAALLCAVVFGANDFYMGGGTNWAGATLRHDWMVALGLGLCALRLERHRLGGALLATASVLRAFPVFAVLGLALPIIVSLAGGIWRERRVPSVLELWGQSLPLRRATEGVVAGLVAWVGLSVLVLPASAWPEWLHKVGMLSGEPHVNHISLKTLFSYSPDHALGSGVGQAAFDWAAAQLQTLEERRVGYWVVASLLTLGAVWRARGAALWRGALLGMLLFPVWLYPANYYLHAVFLFPLLFEAPGWRARRWVGGHVALLAMVAAQYVSVVQEPLDDKFIVNSVLWLAMLLALLTFVGRDRAVAARQLGNAGPPIPA